MSGFGVELSVIVNIADEAPKIKVDPENQTVGELFPF